MRLKYQLIRELWLTQAGVRERYGMQGEPAAAEAGLTLQQPEAQCNTLRHTVCSPREVVPGSQDPSSGRLHRLQGEEVWIETCACTQDSWWLQQQP